MEKSDNKTDTCKTRDPGIKEVDGFDTLRSGEWTDGFAGEFGEALSVCHDECFRLNSLLPSAKTEQEKILRHLLGSTGERIIINTPFRCDFGFNIHIGNNFIGNFNLTILDEAEVRIGDNVFLGPNTSLITIIHALTPQERNAGRMRALPIIIKDNVWIAANVTVLPGVTIGEGAVVGAGSVVTRYVAPFTLVAGNPARKIKDLPRLTDAET